MKDENSFAIINLQKKVLFFIYKVYMRDIDYIKDNKSLEVHILQSIHISLIT